MADLTNPQARRTEALTLTVVVNPCYSSARHAQREIEESLGWLVEDHRAIRLVWGEVVPDEWTDDLAEDE